MGRSVMPEQLSWGSASARCLADSASEGVGRPAPLHSDIWKHKNLPGQ